MGERGEVQGDGPAFGPLDEAGDLVGSDVDVQLAQEQWPRRDSSNASSAAPTSTRRRRTRNRPSGSGIAVRPPSTIVDPAGISATSIGRMSSDVAADELVDVVEHEDERAGAASASMAPNCWSAGEPMVGERAHSAVTHPGSTGSMSSSASAT